MMFAPPFDNMHQPIHGGLHPSHALHPISVKPPSLIHADDDAYASLPPTPTSPFDLPPPGSGWGNHHSSPLSQQQMGCNRALYGSMGPGLAADVAIAGQGQYMNVSALSTVSVAMKLTDRHE